MDNRVSQNTPNSTNTSDIALNTSGVLSNTTGIAMNTTDISWIDLSDISVNASAIAGIDLDYLTSSSLSGCATASYVDSQSSSVETVAGLSSHLSVDTSTNAVVFSGANIYVQSGSCYSDDNTTAATGGNGTGCADRSWKRHHWL